SAFSSRGGWYRLKPRETSVSRAIAQRRMAPGRSASGLDQLLFAHHGHKRLLPPVPATGAVMLIAAIRQRWHQRRSGTLCIAGLNLAGYFSDGLQQRMLRFWNQQQ